MRWITPTMEIDPLAEGEETTTRQRGVSDGRGGGGVTAAPGNVQQ